jgi:hypothetical protein
MTAFRRLSSSTAPPVSLAEVRCLIAELVQPGHFFAGPGTVLASEHTPAEEGFWEIYKGRLLDGTQTRHRRTLEAWNVFLTGRTTPASAPREPVMSIKLDAEAGQLHVTRAVLCHAWEGYDAGGNVYLSREVQKWVRELVATVDLRRFTSLDELRIELIGRLFQAVVGVSRLPLTSREAPLPGFTLGELGYFHQPDLHDAAPMRSADELVARGLHAELADLERIKLLELLLRAGGEASEGREPPETPTRGPTPSLRPSLFLRRWQELGQTRADLLALLRNLFEEVSLSPWTDFVDQVLAFLRELTDTGTLRIEDTVDFLSYLLRQLARHLTAYDLVTFHHFGANYPDALLLDAALKEYLDLAGRRPDLFEGPITLPRLRRRALRQAWLLRRWYEGHPVPDAPTSQGENARVLPPPHVRVPEEQIVNPIKRTRRLFTDAPRTRELDEHGRRLLTTSIHDLTHPDELRELGMALYLDRPLGVFKAPGEPDQTLLFSYEAFSRTIAERRLRYLHEQLHLFTDTQEYEARLRQLHAPVLVLGVPLQPRTYRHRPEPVSLDDAFKAADDFLLLRSTRRSVTDFLTHFDFAPLSRCLNLEWLSPQRRVLIVRSATEPGVLMLHDAELHLRLEVQVEAERGYVLQRDAEYPAAGLRARRMWQQGEPPREQELRGAGMVVLPRADYLERVDQTH